MSKGGFVVETYPVDEEHPISISFKRRPPDEPQPSVEETAFATEIGKALARINALMGGFSKEFPANDRYRDYFQRVLLAARNGVGSDIGDLAQGQAGLSSVKDYFVSSEGPRLRKDYLSRLHDATVRVGLLALVALIVLENISAGQFMVLEVDWRQPAQSLAVATLGICLATWTYRMLTNETLTWDNLRQYGASAYSPNVRYLVLIAMVVVMMILLGTRIVELTVVSFDLSSFTSDPKSAIVIGLFAGLAEKRMTLLVLNTFNE